MPPLAKEKTRPRVGTEVAGNGAGVAYLGIDPGGAGGMVLISEDGLRVIDRVALASVTLTQLLDWLRSAKARRPRVRAAVELVTGYAPGKKRGPNSNPGSTMFTFGKGVGHLEMALTAAEIPWEKVAPQRWQKAVGVSGKKPGEADTAWKRRLKERAEALFPGSGMTNWAADAVLIAEWLRRERAPARD